MPGRQRKFDCTITWARSTSAQCEFPILVFRADADYATAGYVSLTSTESNEVVAVLLPVNEEGGPPESDAAIENLVNSLLGRNDLRAPTLIRSEESAKLPDDLSFQEFRRLNQPPRLFYTDIYDRAGEAEIVREQSIEDYLNSGGVLTDLISNAPAGNG